MEDKMVSDVVLVGIITAGAAICSALLTNYFDERRFKRRSKEWFLNNILRIKIKSIININAKMTECFDSINFYGTVGVKDIETYNKEIKSKLDSFIKSKNEADIWLEEELIDALNETMSAFRQVTFAIWLQLPKNQLPKCINPRSYDPSVRKLDWREFRESYKKSKKKLKEAVGTEALEKYVKEILG